MRRDIADRLAEIDSQLRLMALQRARLLRERRALVGTADDEPVEVDPDFDFDGATAK